MPAAKKPADVEVVQGDDVVENLTEPETVAEPVVEQDPYVGVHALIRELNPKYKIGDTLSPYQIITNGDAVGRVEWAKDQQ